MSALLLPAFIQNAIARTHPSWHETLRSALLTLDTKNPRYFDSLLKTGFYPTNDRLLDAFRMPMESIRYVLIGEGPYPREESATGFSFMDGAVGSLWNESTGAGLAKNVNKATSLRNFLKMLMVAEGVLDIKNTTNLGIAEVAESVRNGKLDFVTSLPELQFNLSKNGFLLLNASLVFRHAVKPIDDARVWQDFLKVIFQRLVSVASASTPKASLILWGKIAKTLDANSIAPFVKFSSEHPYNISFISNAEMQNLFAPMHLLRSSPEFSSESSLNI